MNVEEAKEKKSASEVPVVKEHLDVFLEDLSGLPADREIEFTIDLILGTKIISILAIE